MLQKIRIQNFRSLKDVTVDLQHVNLLIGPNNSGKSNFLKALEFFLSLINNKKFEENYFKQILFRDELKNLKANNEEIPISIELISKYEDYYEHYILQIFDLQNNSKRLEFIGKTEKAISTKINLFDITII